MLEQLRRGTEEQLRRGTEEQLRRGTEEQLRRGTEQELEMLVCRNWVALIPGAVYTQQEQDRDLERRLGCKERY